MGQPAARRLLGAGAMSFRAPSCALALALATSACGSEESSTSGGGDPAKCAAPPAASAADVELDSGLLHGVETSSGTAFLGVPYAAPPVSDRRFAPPEPTGCLGERTAAEFAPACVQYDESGALVGQEDCLYLNIWVPRSAAEAAQPRPVMFFIHGGGFQQGSASEELGGLRLYDGERLAEQTGNVVVTIDYRLGPFGYLAHPAFAREGEASGNFGTLDQIAALGWVQGNITAFHGDAARVLLFGESAGGVSVCALLTSPKAQGLYARALIESGACTAKPLGDAEELGASIATNLGCEGESAADCLRGASVADLMGFVEPTINIASAEALPFRPVIDGAVLVEDPMQVIVRGEHEHVPIVLGTNTEETGKYIPAITSEAEYQAAVTAYATPFGGAALVDAVLAAYPASDYPSYRRAFIALTSDAKFVCTARRVARALVAAQSEPVFRYVFLHVADNAGALAQANGAVHGLELAYLFDHLELQTAAGSYVPGDGDRAVVSAMQGYWGSFAEIGQPQGSVAWPAYALDTEPYLGLEEPLATGEGWRSEQCDFWDSVLP